MGFTVLQVYPTFGGQYLCLEAVPAEAVFCSGGDTATNMNQMSRDVEVFGKNYRDKVQTWSKYLGCALAAGTQTVVWGAGSKGVTFLNAIEDGGRVQGVIDVNPHKQGMYIGGTGQAVMSPEQASELHVDAILVMNAVYRDEIRERVTQLGLSSEIIVV
jgi:hypothetical protein